jgi:hypothetical protein
VPVRAERHRLGRPADPGGEVSVVVAGGMESMSGAPYLLPEPRGGAPRWATRDRRRDGSTTACGRPSPTAHGRLVGRGEPGARHRTPGAGRVGGSLPRRAGGVGRRPAGRGGRPSGDPAAAGDPWWWPRTRAFARTPRPSRSPR